MNNILLSRTPDIVETTLKVSSGNKPKLNKKSRKPDTSKGLRDFFCFGGWVSRHFRYMNRVKTFPSALN